LLLGLLTGSTAIADLFFWTPIFAFSTRFESCTYPSIFSSKPKSCVRDYARGVGRVMVTLQCVSVGLFYLVTTIVAWGAFVTAREQQFVDREMRVRKQWKQFLEKQDNHTNNSLPIMSQRTQPQTPQPPPPTQPQTPQVQQQSQPPPKQEPEQEQPEKQQQLKSQTQQQEI